MKIEISEATKNTLIAAVAGAIAGLLSSSTNFLAQDMTSAREHDARMVEIAVGILRADPKPEIIGARTWAIRVINSSSVHLTRDEAESLTKNALPYIPSLDFSDSRNSQYLALPN